MSKPVQDLMLSLWHFSDEVYLRCPHCAGLAISRVAGKASCSSRRLTCGACGYAKLWLSKSISRPRGAAIDIHFNLPLYLQAPCSGQIVWAYNPEQLDYLLAWIAAPLRSRRRDSRGAWVNTSYLSRLPAWMKSAKNREELLRVLQSLQAQALKLSD